LAFAAPIVTKLLDDEQNYMENARTEFYPNSPRNFKIAGKLFFLSM